MLLDIEMGFYFIEENLLPGFTRGRTVRVLKRRLHYTYSPAIFLKTISRGLRQQMTGTHARRLSPYGFEIQNSTRQVPLD
jgi:hypothetical protein